MNMSRLGPWGPPVALVVLWRVLAWRWPSPWIEISPAASIPLLVLAGSLLACGLMSVALWPGRSSRLLMAYCLAGAAHWGGAIGVGTPEIDQAMLGLYLAVSSLGSVALLLWCLGLFRSWRPAGGVRWLALPSLATLVWHLVIVPAGEEQLTTVAALQLGLARLFEIAAVLTLAVTVVLRRRAPDCWLALVVAMAAVGSALLASLGEIWSLGYLAVAVAMSWAGRRSEAAAETRAASRRAPHAVD